MAELSSTNVYGNLTISGLLKGTYLRLSQANGGNESASLIELGNRKSNLTYGINFNAYYDGSWKYRSSDYGASIGLNNDGSLLMYVNASGTADSAFSWSNATYIKLLNNGNVGINKNPLYKLDVEGDVNIASSSKYKINGTNLNVVAGNGLTGGGDFAPGATITLGTPGTLTSTTTNAVTTSSHTHSVSGFVITGRNITAGSGLTGGGDLSADRTITLGTPGALTGSTSNFVSTSSHTHTVTLTASDVGAPPTTRSITAGNGLTGGGNLTLDRTLTLGTPSTLTASTSNAVSMSSHTHAITGFATTSHNHGTGTQNYIPKFKTTSTFENSIIYQDTINGRIGIGKNNPSYTLDVEGSIRANTRYYCGVYTGQDAVANCLSSVSLNVTKVTTPYGTLVSDVSISLTPINLWFQGGILHSIT